MSSVNQIISRLKEKKIDVNSVLSRAELRKRLTKILFVQNNNNVVSQAILNVQGMSCGHCVNSIEGNVGRLNGVEFVKVNLDEGKVDVRFDPSVVP